MKIVHKLILLIVVGFFGSVLISVIGFTRLSDVNKEMRNVMDNTLPSFNALNNANIDFLELRLLLRSHVLTSDPNAKQALEPKITDKIKELDTDLVGYEALVSDEQDRALFEKVKKDVLEYEQESKATLDFSRQNKTEDAIKSLANAANSVNV